jgi:two-component system, sensor histidine kinase
MRGDQEKCLAAGCTGYLTKPINIDQLLDAVANALGSRADAPDADCLRSQPEPARSGQRAPAIVSTLLLENPAFQQIVDEFIEQLAPRIGDMQTAAAAADFAGLARAAHWLKGSGGTIGFDCFTEPASRLERSAKQRDVEAIAEALAEISELVERIAAPA